MVLIQLYTVLVLQLVAASYNELKVHDYDIVGLLHRGCRDKGSKAGGER